MLTEHIKNTRNIICCEGIKTDLCTLMKNLNLVRDGLWLQYSQDTLQMYSQQDKNHLHILWS